MKIASVSILCIGLALPLGAAAADFSLGYEVDRVPAAQLSVQACNAAIGRGAAALGYVVRANQDQKTLSLHVSGPRPEGRSLVAYCIAAGNHTAWVVQAFDYSGPGLSEPGVIAKKVAGEIRKAIKPAAR